MSDVTILTILKFAGVIIALATTMWGMTRKTTFEDEAGRKRLTPAGHVAVALALGSFLVAGASQGFETLARQGEERIKAQEKADQAQKEADRAQKEEAKAAREFRNEQEARILTLKAAEEQRDRDLALSRKVGVEAERNLGRTGRALSQLERLLQPLGQWKVLIVWNLQLEGKLPRLRDFITQAAKDRSLLKSQKVDAFEVFGILDSIDIRSESPMYLSPNTEPEIYDAITSGVYVKLFKKREIGKTSPMSEGDISFSFPHNKREFSYSRKGVAVVTVGSDEPGFVFSNNTGSVSSLKDLDGSLVVIGRESSYTLCIEKKCKDYDHGLRQRLYSVVPLTFELSNNGRYYILTDLKRDEVHSILIGKLKDCTTSRNCDYFRVLTASASDPPNRR